MKRFMYLVLVVAFIVALPVSHLVMASGPAPSLVCHRGRVFPVPSDGAVAGHEKHGDCENPPGDIGDYCWFCPLPPK